MDGKEMSFKATPEQQTLDEISQDMLDFARDVNGWCVTVSRYGDNILTIEERMLSGKSDLTEDDNALIRHCARHLLAFAHPSTRTSE